MSIIMSINRNTFFQPYMPFFDIFSQRFKNFEEKLKYSIKKYWENLVFALWES